MGTPQIASPIDPSHDDNWHGGFYELAIKLGPHDDERLDIALRTLWDAAKLQAPFRRSSEELPDVSADSLVAGHLASIASIPQLGSTLVSAVAVREETWANGVTHFGADWLDLCLPVGALGNLDARVGAYPFDEGRPSRGWREPIEQWFSGIAQAVFQACGFVHAVTGNEVSGIELSEAQGGWLGVFSPSAQGTLAIQPVKNW